MSVPLLFGQQKRIPKDPQIIMLLHDNNTIPDPCRQSEEVRITGKSEMKSPGNMRHPQQKAVMIAQKPLPIRLNQQESWDD